MCSRWPRSARNQTIQNSVENMVYAPRKDEYTCPDEGILLRRNRSIRVEGVFGVLKEDYLLLLYFFCPFSGLFLLFGRKLVDLHGKGLRLLLFV